MNDKENCFDFSVIICVYNCSFFDLKVTLDSIIKQQNINYEIIVADDCSSVQYIDELEHYIETNDVRNIRYLKNEKNIGTVNNIVNALSYCKGKYIKTIGSGDVLYSCFTLNRVFRFMEKENSQICFGNALSYKFENSNCYINSFYSPINKQPYINQNINEISRYLLIYGDQISGAVTFYTKSCLSKYLEIISNKIIYVEDYIPRLIHLDKVSIEYINETVIMYQFGTGISTKTNTKNNQRLENDADSFSSLVISYAPDNKYIKKYLLFRDLRNSTSIIRFIKKIIISPLYVKFYFQNLYLKKKKINAWKLIDRKTIFIGDNICK